jgi:alpha-glucuronidase
MRYTTTNLKKIEAVLGEIGYTIRYEKGNFQSGYCLVENRRIAVVNKFFDTEARINTLLDILFTLEIDMAALAPATTELIEKWKSADQG